MSKRSIKSVLLGMILALLFAVVFSALPNQAVAKNKTVAVEGMHFNVNFSMTDNFKSLIGKKVSVSIISGKTYTGFVKEVGPHLIHLEKLENKDYFDALIRTENVSAIDARFRSRQR